MTEGTLISYIEFPEIHSAKANSVEKKKWPSIHIPVDRGGNPKSR